MSNYDRIMSIAKLFGFSDVRVMTVENPMVQGKSSHGETVGKVENNF
jgi:hypothetical protein